MNKLYKIVLVFTILFATTGGSEENVTNKKVAGIGVALRQRLKGDQTHNIPVGFGLIITGISPNAAVKDKLQTGDVLYKINDQFVINIPQLNTLLTIYKPGDRVKLTAISGNKEKIVVDVELIARNYEPVSTDLITIELPNIELKPFDLDTITTYFVKINDAKVKNGKQRDDNNISFEVDDSVTFIDSDDKFKYVLTKNCKVVTFTVKETVSNKIVFIKQVVPTKKHLIPENYLDKFNKMYDSLNSDILRDLLKKN